MVDIAMCNRRDCSKRTTCYRYLAFPDEMQTYLVIDKPEIDNCEYYWRWRNPKELREMNKLNNMEEFWRNWIEFLLVILPLTEEQKAEVLEKIGEFQW